jgi:hypothetical protein
MRASTPIRSLAFWQLPIAPFLCVCALGSFFAALAKDIPLSGEQDGLFERGEYVVVKTVTVRSGRTISFAAGSVVRFMPYTGLVVQGSLVCRGEPSSPVVFTSDENRQPPPTRSSSPAPFDWNGIEVADSADSCVCAFVQISFSAFGISVKSSHTLVRLDNVLFQKNGRGDLSVAGADQSAQDNAPFTYTNAVPGPRTVSPQAANFTTAPKPVPKPFPWKFTARIGCGALGLAGLVLGLYGHFDANKNYAASQSAAWPDADTYWKKMQTSVTIRNIGYAVGAAGAAGFAVTFIF